MDEETGMKGSKGMMDSSENAVEADSHTSESRRGPTWRGWVLSIIVAIALSVTATLLLGGSVAFRSDRVAASGAASGGSGPGAGSNCCPPADAEK